MGTSIPTSGPLPTAPPGGGPAPPLGGWDWKTILGGISGVLSVGGEIYSAQANRAEAQRNRDFQERMSSSAVQRSVADYEAAGLNKGLAYERSASSPGGAQASIGSPVGGINNAIQTAATVNAIKMAQDQNAADLALKYTQQQVNNATAINIAARTPGEVSASKIREQEYEHNIIAQPLTQAQMRMQNLMTELGIPVARRRSEQEGAISEFLLEPGIAGARQFKDALERMFNRNQKR